MCVILVAAPPARADGKVFRILAEDPTGATMPDQQALIHFKDGVETLAIETALHGFAGELCVGGAAAAAPEVSPATPGLFKTLRAMHQPEIRGSHQSFLVVSVPVALVLLVMIGRPRLGWRVLLYILLPFLALVMLLPTLGKARGIAGGVEGVGGVTEVSRQLVGEFEVTVVESEEPDALVKWLKERRFEVSAAAEKVIGAYVADGWVFAAAKMRRDASTKVDGLLTPHPLVFKFPVKAPVYPMRLTGVENGGPLKVDLYVLADSRAEAPGFRVERCGECRV